MKKIINKLYRVYQKRQKIKEIEKIGTEHIKQAYKIKNNNALSKKTKQQRITFLLWQAYAQIHLIRVQPYNKFFNKKGGGTIILKDNRNFFSGKGKKVIISINKKLFEKRINND